MGGAQVGWGGVGKWGDIGDDSYPNFLQPFLENIDRKRCNDGSRELIPVYHNPQRKCRSTPSAVARTLQYQVRINIQKAREYLEGGV